MLAEVLTITFANFSGSLAVFDFIGDVDYEPYDVLRFSTSSTQNCDDVCQRPIELFNEVVANNLLLFIPGNLPGDKQQFAVSIGNEAVRITTGRTERVGIDNSESQCEERLPDPRSSA